jgi:hypothetical protein
MDSSSTANFFSIGSLSYLFVCVCVCVYVKRLTWYYQTILARKHTKPHLSISISISLTRQTYALTVTQPQTHSQPHRKYSSRKAWPSSEPAAAKAACAKAYFSAHLLSFANFAST